MVFYLRRLFSILMFLVGVSWLIWGAWPVQQQVMEQFILPDAMRLQANGEQSSPALLEVRRVRVEWPETLRIGDQYDIRLVFEPVSSEILVPSPQANLTDVYATDNLMAEGRFEVAGMRVNPPNPTRESLLAGQTIQWRWQVNALEAGDYSGNVWLSLRFLPLDGSNAAEVPIFIHVLKLHAHRLFGVGGSLARILGIVLMLSGFVLSYDVMISLLRKWQE